MGTRRSQIVTYVCVLLGLEVLFPGLCFSVLTIPVQAVSLGHALTTMPSIWCAPMVISTSPSTRPTTLGSNGWKSEAFTALGTSLTIPELVTLTNLCPYTLMCVLQ
jgi:hypothetical protein